VGDGPVFGNWANISDDLSVVGPGHLDGVGGTNTGTTWVTAGSEPMVLGSTGSSSSHTFVLSSINGVTEDVICENGVVRNASSGQVMGQGLHDFQNLVNIVVTIFNHKGEGSEHLSRQQLSLLRDLEVLKGHEDASGLVRTIDSGDFVVLERDTAPQDLGAVELKDGINVSLDLLVVP